VVTVGEQTLLRLSGWRGTSVELVAELLDLSSGGATVDTRPADENPPNELVRGPAASGATIAGSNRRLRLSLDWWGQLTAIQTE
jgi:hypothetical protein